jgi:hypothetical protein
MAARRIFIQRGKLAERQPCCLWCAMKIRVCDNEVDATEIIVGYYARAKMGRRAWN